MNRGNYDDFDPSTPDDRRRGIACILAAGVLRLHSRAASLLRQTPPPPPRILNNPL